MFWTDGDEIMRANLDATGTITLINSDITCSCEYGMLLTVFI